MVCKLFKEQKAMSAVKNTDSTCTNISCGVPQESILFLLHINGTVNVSNVLLPMLLADDTSLLINDRSTVDIVT